VGALFTFLLIFTPLVFIHELGHYFVARWCGVKVEAFSVGFGRVLWRREAWGTEWRLAAIPLGGYVKLAGEQDASEEADPDGLWSKSPLQRAAIAVAGPAVNLITPVFIFAAFLIANGYTTVPPVIGTVAAGSAAEAANLRAGDRILAIDGDPLRTWDDLRQFVTDAAGKPLLLTIRRGEHQKIIKATPKSRTVEDALGGVIQRGMLGISSVRQSAVVTPTLELRDTPVRPFDHVVAIDGKPIADLGELYAALTGPTHHWTVLRQRGRKVGHKIDPKKAKKLTFQWTRPSRENLGFAYAELVIEGVKPGSPAAATGLQVGDRILSVGGQPVRSWMSLDAALLNSPGYRADIDVARGAERLTVALALKPASVSGPLRSKREVLDHGITRTFWHLPQTTEHRDMGLIDALIVGTEQCAAAIATMAEGLRRIAVGSVSASQIGGPVMLYDIAADVAEKADPRTFWWWFALLSLNLGLMNLLPIPVLDGGLIMLSAIEIVRRKPLTLEARAKANTVGLVFVLGLMGLAIINDVVRLITS
jgi:regulator of sigma E protease